MEFPKQYIVRKNGFSNVVLQTNAFSDANCKIFYIILENVTTPMYSLIISSFYCVQLGLVLIMGQVSYLKQASVFQVITK